MYIYIKCYRINQVIVRKAQLQCLLTYSITLRKRCTSKSIVS